MVTNTSKSFKSYNISNWINRLQSIKRIRNRAIENISLFTHDMVHQTRGPVNSMPPTTPHPLSTSSSQGRVRLGTGPSQSSRDDADSVISSSMSSPAIPGSAGIFSNSSFDYESVTRQIALPDFILYTKEQY